MVSERWGVVCVHGNEGCMFWSIGDGLVIEHAPQTTQVTSSMHAHTHTHTQLIHYILET